ncbi:MULTISPECIES: hypothetical protein [unclassified Bartonella]|uniref:hypothetical protein n=1 Tax=unclassified Bartonella TaxID=2645622 RepID=UPI0035CF6E94
MPFSKFININPINNVMMIFLLESPILDKYVNDERNEFEINKIDPDLETQLTWDDINQTLKNTLNKILTANFRKLKKKKSTLLKKIASLELTQYIQFRDDILNQFSKLLTPKTLEKDIHNLFIHQGKTADKFMSYNHLQSEKTIQELLSNVDSLSINSERKKQNYVADLI